MYVCFLFARLQLISKTKLFLGKKKKYWGIIVTPLHPQSYAYVKTHMRSYLLCVRVSTHTHTHIYSIYVYIYTHVYI